MILIAGLNLRRSQFESLGRIGESREGECDERRRGKASGTSNKSQFTPNLMRCGSAVQTLVPPAPLALPPDLRDRLALYSGTIAAPRSQGMTKAMCRKRNESNRLVHFSGESFCRRDVQFN